MPLRVAVVDDHPMFLNGVIATLAKADEVEVVGDGASAADALRLAAEARPDIMLLDLGMPGGGINALREIKQNHPPVMVIMLTVSDRTDDVVSAMHAGASGYLVKSIHRTELIDAMQRAQDGGIVIDDSFAIRIVHGAGVDASALSSLTTLEKHVLHCLADGMSRAAIVRSLDSTAQVVQQAISRLARKLNVLEQCMLVIDAMRSHAGDRTQGTRQQ